MFKTSRYFGLKTACALGLLFALGLAGESLGAVKTYQMTGSWLAQRGTAGIPLQFVLTKTMSTTTSTTTNTMTPTTTTSTTHTGGSGTNTMMNVMTTFTHMNKVATPLAVGKHNFPIAFPNGDVMGSGTVGAKGMSPANLSLPLSIFSSKASVVPPGFPLPGVFNVQITTDFTNVLAPGPSTPVTPMGGGGGGGVPATLSAGGGPGNITYCPKAAFNVSVGISAVTCPNGLGAPPAGGGPRNGRVLYQAGPNSFGGTMQMLLKGSGLVTRVRTGFGFGDMTFQAFHNTFGGGGGMLQNQGGAQIGTTASGQKEWAHDDNDLPGGPYTQPKIAPTATNQPILVGNAGPKITVGGLFTACPPLFNGGMGGATTITSYTNFSKCTAGQIGTMTTLLTPGIAITNNTGFPFTTGMVFAQQSTNTGGGIDNFSLSGSDARTPKGVGQITLVAGGLSIRKTAATLFSTGSAETVVMTMSQKVPTMSKTGFAAAAALMVLAVGYAFRRRF